MGIDVWQYPWRLHSVVYPVEAHEVRILRSPKTGDGRSAYSVNTSGLQEMMRSE